MSILWIWSFQCVLQYHSWFIPSFIIAIFNPLVPLDIQFSVWICKKKYAYSYWWYCNQIYFFICSCQSVGTVNFTLPFTTNVTISISILQTFRSWVATSHLRPPMAFLSHNSSDTPGLAPLMNVLFWERCDFPISFSGRDMSRNVWNRL